MSSPWWKSAVVYQVYPRSLLDTDGDGIGDLEGIRRRLDHLVELGVDALWLSPIYPSPMADFGYDVADYTGVDPVFGDLDAFDRLLADAHDRGLRVLLDWVPNHTSDQHDWFLASRSSRDDPQRGWYVWRDRPNNWTASWQVGSAWTYDEPTGQHYLHLYLPQQPDLNWANPDVVEAMHGVLRFRLDRGVDGFRADVIHLIGKDPALPDDPPELVGTSRGFRHDMPVTHDLVRGIRTVLDGYDGDRVMVGEVNLHEHGGGRALLRPGRRAAPSLQLRSAVRALGRRGLAGDHHRGARRLPSGRRLADLGAGQSRPVAPAHPLRLGGARPRRRGRAADPAGHAIAVRGRRAGPGGRGGAARAGGRPGRPRRLPRPAALGRHRAARLGRRALAALAARRGGAQRREAARRRGLDPVPVPKVDGSPPRQPRVDAGRPGVPRRPRRRAGLPAARRRRPARRAGQLHRRGAPDDRRRELEGRAGSDGLPAEPGVLGRDSAQLLVG